LLRWFVQGKWIKQFSFHQYWRISENLELKQLGMIGWTRDDRRLNVNFFDLKLIDLYNQWKGRLIVEWSGERSLARWVKPNSNRIKAILRESEFSQGMPKWNELRLNWEELKHLPKSWIGRLSDWRGIYLIIDGKDGGRYVGSAIGADSLYGRWIDYSKSGDGGNKRLRDRAPDKFIFSILEIVAPNTSKAEVVRLENNWKDRLQTRKFGLNAN
jgi:GIY-YIG catalytic domain